MRIVLRGERLVSLSGNWRICSMQQKTLLVWVVACAITIAACSETPQSTLSPTAVDPSTSALNPDGSSLKVNAPSDLSPNGITVNTRPTLTFTAQAAKYAPVAFAHEVEVQNAEGNVVYARMVDPATGVVNHDVASDLPTNSTLWFRARARSGDLSGPWSGFAQFGTSGPALGGGGGGSLPFPVPDACGPFGPHGRLPCVLAVAAQSVEWQACAAGRGVNCHRFTRQVVYALSQSDPNFQMILAQPGNHACNCSGCGGSDGATMFREDTTVYGGRSVFDMITGAGGPSPGLTWSHLGDGGPRPGDLPRNAPLCAP
jgi:hypothetical protein